MSNITTKFWVEVLENDEFKIVPHTGKKSYMFIDRIKAKEFLTGLRENNPDTIFRLVILKEEYIFGIAYSKSILDKLR